MSFVFSSCYEANNIRLYPLGVSTERELAHSVTAAMQRQISQFGGKVRYYQQRTQWHLLP
jgi:hypothetical protein